MCEGVKNADCCSSKSLMFIKLGCVSKWILRDLSYVGDILNVVFYLDYNLKIGINIFDELHFTCSLYSFIDS